MYLILFTYFCCLKFLNFKIIIILCLPHQLSHFGAILFGNA